ncbi:MAG TPA: aminotransferase class I/II-fold pyridoxal phosphate-dependent enzyme [Acidimicrobiales bacterium]
MIPPAGPHGGDGPEVARALGLDPDDVVDLSLSLNPFAPDVGSLAARHLSALRHYPGDADVSRATHALAEAIGVDRGRVLLSNGGSEAIALVTRIIGGTVAGEPEFSLHPRGEGGARWRSNPKNPTGLLADRDETADVWDEAFYPLAAGTWTRGDAGAVVVGSLTKVFACPGLRLGYVIADDVSRYASAQPAWAVNGLALAVLPELLAHTDLARWSQRITARRDELDALLRARGFDPLVSQAPWLLVYAPGLRDQLAPHGVVVRDCASFGLAGYVRIAVPDDQGLARLCEVLPSAVTNRIEEAT